MFKLNIIKKLLCISLCAISIIGSSIPIISNNTNSIVVSASAASN